MGHIRKIAIKYSVKLILCSCIFLSISAKADTWGFPERKEFYSPEEVVRFTIIPSRNFDNFRVGPIGLLERKNKMGEYTLVWINKLSNAITPIRAAVSNSGNYVVTIDDYLMAGQGDNTIVLYGKYGNKIANFELSDALSKEQIQELPRSVSSIWWYCGATIIDEKAKHISIKIKPTRDDKEQCGEIIIDIESLGISYLNDVAPISKNTISPNIETASPASVSFFPPDDRINERRQRIQKEISESPEIIKLIRTFQFMVRSDEFPENTSYSEQNEILYDEIKNAIKSGVDVNKKDKQGKTALSYASGYQRIVILLLDNGADPTINLDDWNYEFLNAVQHGRINLVETMIKAGASIEYIHKNRGHTPLTMAILYKYSEIIEILLKYGANPNRKCIWDRGGYPLDEAISSGYWEGVDLLIKAGASIDNVKKKNALLYSVHTKNSESLKLLLKEPFKTRPRDYVYEKAIIHAVSLGYDEGIKLLVDSGVSPDSEIYSYNSTPLMEAAKNGFSRTIKNLLKMGADPNKKDKYGFGALDVAILFGQKESEKILKENGAVAGIFSPSAINLLKGNIEKMKSIKRH